MISKGWSYKQAGRMSALLAATALAVGVAACGGSSGGASAVSTTATDAAATPPQAPATTTAPSSTTPAPPPTAPAPPAAPAGIPDYHPSTIVNKNPNSTVLTSSDSVTQVADFYKGALAKGGWQIRASSSTAYSASFSAHRANEGVSISVYPRGSGSGISISTHPE